MIFIIMFSQVAGILAAAHLGNLIAALMMLPLAAISWLVIGKARPRHDFNRIAALCALVLAGFLVGALSIAGLDLAARGSVAELAGNSVKIKGEIQWIYESVYGRQFMVSGIEIEGRGRIKGKALIETSYPDLEGLESAKPGYEISGEVELGLIAGAMNPGGFDARAYWALKGVCVKILPKGHLTAQLGKAPILVAAAWELYEAFRGFSSRSLSVQDQKAMMDAIVLSDKSSLDPLIRDTFSEGGIAHVMSASGLHVSIVIGAISFTMSRLGASPTVQFAILAAVLPVYAIAAGLRPSIIRALLMGLMALVFKLVKVKDPGLIVKLGTSGVIQLAISPASLFDRGFLLSYAAILGIVGYSWLPQPLKKEGLPNSLAAYLQRGIYASLAITAFTLPITSTFYGRISMLGPLANLIAIPAASGALAVGLGAFSVNLAWPWLGSILMQISRPFLSALIWTAGFVSSIRNLTFKTGYGPGLHTAVFYSALALSLIVISGRLSMRRIAKLSLRKPAASMALIVVLSLSWLLPGRQMEVDVFSVGQGDSTLITDGGGFTMLVDTGPAYNGNSAVEDKILPALRHMGVSRIDVLMLTHGHSDHVSGLDELAMSMGIGVTMVPEGDEDVIKAAVSAGLKPISCLAGDVIESGSMKIKILNPAEPIRQGDDLNEKSLVAMLSFQASEVLLQADAGYEFEGSYKGNGIDVLKVGHHGSKTASGEDFLSQLSPAVAIVSVGKNLYGHPSTEAMERLAKACPVTLRTDISGMVRIVSTNNGTNVTTSSELWAARPFFRALRP